MLHAAMSERTNKEYLESTWRTVAFCLNAQKYGGRHQHRRRQQTSKAYDWALTYCRNNGERQRHLCLVFDVKLRRFNLTRYR